MEVIAKQSVRGRPRVFTDDERRAKRTLAKAKYYAENAEREKARTRAWYAKQREQRNEELAYNGK